MTFYHHTEVQFRHQEMSITYSTHNGELDDWYFTGLDTKQHQLLSITADENYEIEDAILAHMVDFS